MQARKRDPAVLAEEVNASLAHSVRNLVHPPLEQLL